MAGIALKNILSKKNEAASVILSLMQELKANVYVEDTNGKILLGDASIPVDRQQAVNADDEIIGWVKGDGKAEAIAEVLALLARKESEKKKLGSEVLNLYQQINIIFNYSDKLAQTIDASSIAQMALDETAHVIKSNSSIVVLWNEQTEQLDVIASKGILFIEPENINPNIELLRKIIFGGQSEILEDCAPLSEAGIVLPEVKSLIYSSLKVRHRIMGAIILASNEDVQYSAGDLKLLTTIALQSSSAIESALLFEKNIREAQEREQAMRRIYEVTGKFVPHEFIRSLGHEVITEVRLGDQVEKIVTVLFSDIRDYTSFSERMTPEENFRFVSSFNEFIGPIIRKHTGFINQYLGDAIMAIFPNNASDALAAAIDMQRAVREFNILRQQNAQSPIQIGIGMHTGPLIMGITGDYERMDATTISDTVNTASRLETLTKHFKTNIIVSDATVQQLMYSQDFYLRPLGPVQVKGKQKPLSIYECFNGDPIPQIEKKLTTLTAFREGMTNYLNKSFGKAFIAFQGVCEENPHDLTVNFFLGKAAKYIAGGVPENWLGVEEVLSK